MDLRNRLGDIPGLLSRHLPQARQLLRKLLDGHITCEPIADEDGKPGYRFTATGTFDRLLRGAKVVNDSATYSGGGHGSFNYLHKVFTPPLRVSLRQLKQARSGATATGGF